MILALLLLAWPAAEPRGQEYVLLPGERVLFWRDDEMPPRIGVDHLVWGYWPEIVCDGEGFAYRDVQWCRANE